jgi:hypothetical protein
MTSDQAQAWLAVAAALLALYAISCLRNPDTKCKECNGGRKYGWVFNEASRPCRYCEGSGRIPRVGVWIVRVIAKRIR